MSKKDNITFHIGGSWQVREYNNYADKAEDITVEINPMSIGNNPRSLIMMYAEILADKVEEKYPYLKKVKWATAKDLDELEKRLAEGEEQS